MKACCFEKEEEIKKEVYDKLIKIFEDCNDCRVFEIQIKLRTFLKELYESSPNLQQNTHKGK